MHCKFLDAAVYVDVPEEACGKGEWSHIERRDSAECIVGHPEIGPAHSGIVAETRR
jgi:hypothetical protein